MPLVNIPGVGGVNFPDSMSMDEVSQASAKLYSEASQPAAQAAAQAPLPIPAEMPDVAQMEEARKKAFPSPYEQEQAFQQQAQRNQTAVLSGAASLPVGVVQAFRQNEQQALAPLNQEAQRQGLQPQPTLTDQTLAKLPPEVAQVANFAPQDKSETALQVAGGFLAPENMLLGLNEAVPKYRQQFAPLETAVIPKEVAKNFDSPAVQNALHDAMLDTLKQEAKYASVKPIEQNAIEQLLNLPAGSTQAAKTELPDASNKLRNALLKKEQIKQALVDSKGIVYSNVDWERNFGSKSTPEMIHAEALDRAKNVDSLVEQGLVKTENAGALKVAIYKETLEANGIKVQSEKLNKYDILGELFKWGKVQKRTGVPSGETAQDFVNSGILASNYRAEQKNILSKIIAPLSSKDSVLSDLQYFRTQADGSVLFDPSELNIPGKVNIPRTVKQFSPEDTVVMSNLRTYMDSVADDLGLPKLPGYIPIRELPSALAKAGPDSTLNPTLTQARTSGVFNPEVHEADFFNIMDRYTREASKAKFTGPALEKGIATLNQLRLSGLPLEAESFKKYMLDVFHLNGEKEAAQIFGTHLLAPNKEDIQAFVKLLPESDSVAKEIYDAATRAVYVNLVGINPKTWVKQYLQAPMLGSIELGPTWAASGTKDALNVFTKEGRERLTHAKQLVKASLSQDFGYLDEQFTNAPTNQIAKAIDFINKPGSFITNHTMGAGEVTNRLSSVLGAENKWNYYWQNGGASSINGLLKQSALTTAQRSMISKAFVSGGMENARDIYALVIAQRVNFTYSMADKPELLRSTFGQLFPFTTYTRNILARGAEAISEGKPVNIAKQIAIPISFIAGFTAMTGRDLPSGTHPMSGIADTVTRGLTPIPLIIAQNPVSTLTPLPKNLVKLSLKTPIDLRAGRETLGKKLDIFPEHKPGKWHP